MARLCLCLCVHCDFQTLQSKALPTDLPDAYIPDEAN